MSSFCVCLQASLNKLMETLDQSEPYFVKCIRSNAEKVSSAVFVTKAFSLCPFSCLDVGGVTKMTNRKQTEKEVYAVLKLNIL